MVRRRSRADAPKGPSGSFWLYGAHAARAALKNPRRKILRAILTRQAKLELQSLARADVESITAETPDEISRLLPPGAVHQGVALLCEPLPPVTLKSVLEEPKAGNRMIAVLDQITDPRNEGAILRSATAFGLMAVVVQDRHAPPESGALAKAASGGLDRIPRIAVVNIARSLEELGRFGFWRIALAADAEEPLQAAMCPGDIAIVLGAGGVGLRRVVRE